MHHECGAGKSAQNVDDDSHALRFLGTSQQVFSNDMQWLAHATC
jgi:hypothetical protein